MEWAAYFGYQNLIEPLIARGADVKAPDCVVLHQAVRGRHIDSIRLILSHGANVEQGAERTGTTPLYAAVDAGNAEIVRLLLSHGAVVDQSVIDYARSRDLTIWSLLMKSWINSSLIALVTRKI